jgi:SprT protein
MKHTQLLLQLTNHVRRKLRLVSATKSQVVEPARNGIRREPLLEQLSQQLLQDAGCHGLEVQVAWSTRLRTTAGLATWHKRAIYLNPRLMEVSQEEVQRTLRHELAHFLAQYRAGRKRIAAHGPEWKQACADLGIPDESRCHDLPFKRTKMERRHFYACRECGTQLARVRPLKRRVACLKCCRRHNSGRYHDNFRFVQIPAPEKMAA